jgi:soluble lytic murein transglycosylase
MMSRFIGYAAAGLRILKEMKPAFVTHYGHIPGLLMAGPFALVVMLYGSVDLPAKPLHIYKSAQATQTSEFLIPAGFAPSQTVSVSPVSSPLSGKEAALYADIFRLQDEGRFGEAQILVAQLGDKSLMGHVLAQKLLHPKHKAEFEELKGWMGRYADHPQAAKIAKLANRRAPNGYARFTVSAPKSQNIEAVEDSTATAKPYRSKIKRTSSQESGAQDLISAVRRHVQIYEPSYALRLLNESSASLYLDTVEKDRILAVVASGYLYAGKLEEAEKHARAALQSSGAAAPMAGWVHGLAAWQMKNYKAAAKSFEVAARSDYAGEGMSSAAAYWAARSYGKSGNYARKADFLELAAEHPRSFYGLLAIAALETQDSVEWATPRLNASQHKAIVSTQAGQRAEKLLAAGQASLAETEIRTLYRSSDLQGKKALRAFAYDRNLPSLSMRLAHAIRSGSNDEIDAALYPSMPWSPQKGYRIDRALLHAIARQESKFNPSAQNENSGATGLMQIMPRTAYHVAKDDKFLTDEGRAALKNPEISLALGQKYIEELLNNSLVGQDLLSLAIAYNAGPGTLAKWKSEREGMHDPLLFIETIPFHETRNYVERVMANYWMYRMRFDQPNDSMVALADGKWARYASQDKGAVKFADAR